MATTTMTPAAASTQRVPGGVRLFGQHFARVDLLAALLLLAAALFGLMLAYVRPSVVEIGVVGIEDHRRIHYQQHLANFHDPEAIAGQQRYYRWTQADSAINLPGIGRGLWQTQLSLGSPQPTGQPKQVLIKAGAYQLPLQLTPDLRSYHLLTPSSGDLHVTIDAATAQYGNDPRPLGVIFGGVALQPIAVAALPPALFLFHTLLALTLAFLTLRLIGVPTWLALLGALGGLAVLIWGTALHRGPVGMYSVRLLAVTLVGLLFMLATRWATDKLFRFGGVEIGAAAMTGLMLIVYAGFVIKAGGLLWPYFLSVDIEWHMEKTQRVLTGRIWELWDANSPFHQSVMPVDEWGENRPVIPYSPFYHIFSAIWAIFPWKLKYSAEVFSAALDALRPVMIFFITRKFGFRDRAGIIAALTYSLIPAAFLLHAWGNTPTTNGMWWSLLATAVLVGAWDRLSTNRWAWIGLTIVLTLTMLFYAVTAVFTTLLLLAMALLLLITKQRRQALTVFASITAAVLLSIAIYYWQFVPAIIVRTIPRLTGGFAESGQTLGGQEIIFSDYLIKYVYLLDIYGVYLPLILGSIGWWIGVRKFGFSSLFTILMTVWMVIAIAFWFIGLKLSMVDKQLFWLMPWMGIGTGIAVDRLLSERRFVRLAAPLLILGALYTGSDALYLWTHRLNGYPIGEGYVSWYQFVCRSAYDRQTCIPE
ncbi:MAG: hypothetical protein JOZ51_05420 [Chloroflexi bacterium]|nr:hypothetical protein [Chloroflexota bacterium]